VKTHPGRRIVFCNSIDCVRRLTNLAALAEWWGHWITAYHITERGEWLGHRYWVSGRTRQP
jgi:hypothetical protein